MPNNFEIDHVIYEFEVARRMDRHGKFVPVYELYLEWKREVCKTIGDTLLNTQRDLSFCLRS